MAGDTESALDCDSLSIRRESTCYNRLVLDKDVASNGFGQESGKTTKGRSDTNTPAHSTIRLSQSFNDPREFCQA
jgi:hypothetical protein